MVSQKRIVTVKQMPQTLGGKHRSDFINEVQSCLNMDRPFLVLDCSGLIQTDRDIVHLLLCCLEEAMKRNGDIRLAGVSSKMRTELHAAQADTLFAFYETSADAIASYYGRPSGFALRASVPSEAMDDEKSVA